MEKLRTFILVFVLGCALTATARADGYERQEREEVVVAHAPVACCSNWRGFYFGLNAGALWTESDISAFGTNGGGFVPDFFSQIIAAGQGDAADNSYIVGLQFGYNLQWGHFVLGLETDFNYMKTSTTRSVSVAATGFNNTILHSDTLETDWLYTLRPRAGFLASQSLLIYATAGLAMTKLNYQHTFRLASGQSAFYEASDTKAGWTAGGGLEWAFDPDWRLKVEYLFADFSSNQSSAPISNVLGTNIIGSEADLSVHIVRAGMNFKF
jgi:outer membrane immunogenic protein